MFLQRSASLLPSPNGFTASSVSCEMLKRDQLPVGEAAVLERVGVIAGLGEVARGEFALVGDDQPAFAQVADVGLQRRRVHRDQHVGLVAGGVDRARAEIDLEGGDAEGRALRRADFGREIGEGGEVVAGQRGRQGELPAGQLHAVAAVAGKADDDRFQRRMGVGFLGRSADGWRWPRACSCNSFGFVYL